jgi:hypothetical protein
MDAFARDQVMRSKLRQKRDEAVALLVRDCLILIALLCWLGSRIY